MPKKKAVVDPMGQWKYPGDVTIIPSNSITMQGVNYPVLGVDDLGNAQMMMPGGQYTFPGNYVTEFPQMQLGGMSKRKVDKYLQSNKDLNWVKRLYQPNTPTMYLPGSSVPSTHYMESADGRVYPTIVQRTPNSPLEYLGDDAYDYAMQSGEYIQFPNDRQARRFAESYKKGTDVLKEFGKGGLTQWFAEEWTDIKTGKPCGRQKGEKRAYPACRPKKRVNETTPKTTSEMSSSEKAKFKRVKNSGERISYNHKRREFGGEMGWLDQYQDGGETSTEQSPDRIAPIEISAKRDPWYKRLPRQVADRMGFYPYGYDTNPNDFSSQMARRIGSADSPAGAFFGALTAPLATPQLGAMYAMTGEAQTPSEYYNVQNPYAAFALNALTDPLTYAGTGAFTNIPSKISNTVSRQIYKNPKLGVNLATGLRLPIKNIDNITVSPGLKPGDIELSSFLSPAKGVSEQQFIERLASGAQSLDQSLQKRISDLKSPEGFKRLVNQEKEYYLSKGEIPSVADDLANLSAKARINELENTYSWNTAAKDYGETNVFAGKSELSDFSKDELLLNNAYYRQTSPNSGSTFSPYYKSDPGSIGIGYNVVGNKPIEMHEIAHALQRGRVLPIDDELRQLTPKKNLPSNTQRAYDYFSSGTGGREASAFANELRESMFQKGFIPDYYSPISQQQVQNAYGYFKTNPMGVYDPNNARYLSNTRIFDFMAPTKANSKLLTDILNKLPAAIPVAAGASQLQQQKNGGWLNKYN